MKPRRTRAITGLAAAALATGLSGCGGGSGQPGAAAVVDGETISPARLDTLVEANCSYLEAAKAEGQPVQPVAISQLRSQLLDFLVAATIVEQDVRARGLTIRPGDVYEAMPPVSLPDGLQGSDRATIQGLFRLATRRQVGTWLVSSHLLDPSVRNSAQAMRGQTNQRYFGRLFRRADVEVSPRYGRWTGATIASAADGLSVAGSSEAKSAGKNVAQLPDSQVCG